jgi:hypothetical protein
VADAADEEWQTVSKNYADQSHVLGGGHTGRTDHYHGTGVNFRAVVMCALTRQRQQ